MCVWQPVSGQSGFVSLAEAQQGDETKEPKWIVE